MIKRYEQPDIANIFSESHKYELWIKVELAVLEVQEKYGIVPEGTCAQIRERLSRIQSEVILRRATELEKETEHDVVAFVNALEEFSGEPGKWIHFGLTSSDIVDTAFALQIREALNVVENCLVDLLKTLKDLALKYKNLPIMGRTHGMFAEPTSLGLKFLTYYSAFYRALNDLYQLKETISFGKLSGAVGTNAHLSVQLEKETLEKLDLKPEPASTQVVPRDRHARVIVFLALLGAVIERLAVEIRLLQRTEVGELEEPFRAKQTGSSAMPHKRNPIRTERLTGMARYLRGLIHPALENIALWHERDISHSSVERIIFPDAFHTVVYMLRLLQNVLKGLVVHKHRIAENLKKYGDFYYSQVLFISLIKRGLSRKQAYTLVKKVSQKAYDTGLSLSEVIRSDENVKQYLTDADINSIIEFDFLKKVDKIFERVLGSDPLTK